jgi:hypothetical protein
VSAELCTMRTESSRTGTDTEAVCAYSPALALLHSLPLVHARALCSCSSDCTVLDVALWLATRWRCSFDGLRCCTEDKQTGEQTASGGTPSVESPMRIATLACTLAFVRVAAQRTRGAAPLLAHCALLLCCCLPASRTAPRCALAACRSVGTAGWRRRDAMTSAMRGWSRQRTFEFQG